MRRKDRERDDVFAMEVFDEAPFATLSLVTPDGQPYAVPLSIVRKNENTFYFHCAHEGKKIDCIRHCQQVLLSAVTEAKPFFDNSKGNFTLQYKSATAEGLATIVEDEAEKIEALRAICQRYLPAYMDSFDDAISRSLNRTAIVRIDLTRPPVGKQKQM